MPVGTILAYIGPLNKIPNGWALCDGTEGTPNLLDNRFLEGASTIGIFKEPGLPNITGYFMVSSFYSTPPTTSGGAFHWGGYNSRGANAGSSGPVLIYDFDAARSSLIYGASNTVQPKSYTVYFIL